MGTLNAIAMAFVGTVVAATLVANDWLSAASWRWPVFCVLCWGSAIVAGLCLGRLGVARAL